MGSQPMPEAAPATTAIRSSKLFIAGPHRESGLGRPPACNPSAESREHIACAPFERDVASGRRGPVSGFSEILGSLRIRYRLPCKKGFGERQVGGGRVVRAVESAMNRNRQVEVLLGRASIAKLGSESAKREGNGSEHGSIVENDEVGKRHEAQNCTARPAHYA